MKRIMVTLTLLFLLLCPILASENGVPGGVGGGEMPISGGGQDEEIIEGNATLRISAYKNAAPKNDSASMRFSSSLEGGTILAPDGASTGLNVSITMLDDKLAELYGEGLAIGFFEARGLFKGKGNGTLKTQLEMYPVGTVTYDSESGNSYITSIDTYSFKNENSFKIQGNGGTKTIPMKIERRIDAEQRIDVSHGNAVLANGQKGEISHTYTPEQGLNTVEISFKPGRSNSGDSMEWLFREVYILKIDSTNFPWQNFRDNVDAGTYSGLIRLTATYTTR